MAYTYGVMEWLKITLFADMLLLEHACLALLMYIYTLLRWKSCQCKKANFDRHLFCGIQTELKGVSDFNLALDINTHELLQVCVVICTERADLPVIFWTSMNKMAIGSH